MINFIIVYYEVAIWCSRIGDQSNGACNYYYFRNSGLVKSNGNATFQSEKLPNYDSFNGSSYIGDTVCGFSGTLKNFRVSYASAFTTADNLQASNSSSGIAQFINLLINL